MQADRLSGSELSDADGDSDKRTGTVSVFNGPAPVIGVLGSSADEIGVVDRWLAGLQTQGLMPHELGVFVRSDSELERAKAAVATSGLTWTLLDERVSTQRGRVALGTMHLAKGLAFRAVAVMACDDEVIPSQDRIENVSEEADLEEAYHTERHLLYVACTRARDHLLITGVAPACGFVEDIRPEHSVGQPERRPRSDHQPRADRGPQTGEAAVLGDAAALPGPTIASSRSTRSWVCGWVDNQPATERAGPRGFTMNRLAVAGVPSTGTMPAACSSFSSALASASGSPEILAPVSSARYSREREMPSWIRVAANGATSATSSPPPARSSESSDELPPKRLPKLSALAT